MRREILNPVIHQPEKKGSLTKLWSDMLNEYSMKNLMFSVHKSEYYASKLNISRSEEELFIFFIARSDRNVK